MYAFDRLRRINAAAEPPDSLRSDAPGNDAMPASDDYATAPTPKKRLRPASKRLSRTEATKRVVQEEINSLTEIMEAIMEAIVRKLH